MENQIKAHPTVENAINLFGDWLKYRREMRELRDMDSGEFAHIARDLCVSPAELDAVAVRSAQRLQHRIGGNEERRSRRGDGIEPDTSTMALDDLLCDGKPDAVAVIAAALMQALEHLEHLVGILLVETNAVVLDAE